MNEWVVVGVIITLFGFIAAACKPLITLTKSITELTVAVKSLQTDVREHKNQSHESHRRLWEHNEKQDAQKEINAIKGRNQK